MTQHGAQTQPSDSSHGRRFHDVEPAPLGVSHYGAFNFVRHSLTNWILTTLYLFADFAPPHGAQTQPSGSSHGRRFHDLEPAPLGVSRYGAFNFVSHSLIDRILTTLRLSSDLTTHTVGDQTQTQPSGSHGHSVHGSRTGSQGFGAQAGSQGHRSVPGPATGTQISESIQVCTLCNSIYICAVR